LVIALTSDTEHRGNRNQKRIFYEDGFHWIKTRLNGMMQGHSWLRDLLLNIVPLKDSRSIIIATSGFNEHQLGIVDLYSGEFLRPERKRRPKPVYVSSFRRAIAIRFPLHPE